MKAKLFLLLTFLTFAISSTVLAGGGGGCTTAPSTIPGGCAGADPFCTGTTYTFPNTTGTGNAGALNCLSTTPNPTWYYLQIATGGTIDIQINQTNTSGSGIDVDFALMGPYTSVAAGCSNPASGCVEDCSYSIDASETANITGAVAGEFYLLLLTNFANQAGTITFNQTGGTGSTDCSILAPPCAITGLTATPTACNPANNQYSTSGTVNFSNPPTTGTLTVSNSCGGSQTFSAPFGTSVNYNLAGLTSNGAGCTVTASFSATACTATQAYTAPAACLPCNMTGITTNVGACNPATNLYTVSGQISFTNPPTTGTMTITNSCGGTQTFNAPFASPAAYNFPGLTSNGSACTVSAVFSANPACTISQNFTAPVSCLPPCNITNLTANIGSCLANSTFDVTGTFTYANSPTTGTMVVTVTNSSGSYTQTFNAPFVNGQTYNFNIAGVTANGSALTVSVAFSAAPACTLSLPSTSPPACGCVADIGTFTADVTPTSPNNYRLCFGDEINIEANGNYTPPAVALAPPLPEGYEPGITWLVYTCPPTIALTPSLTQDIPDDPCLLGLYSDFDMYDINDMFWMTAYPPGTFTNNTVYFVPITMYNLTEGTYSYVNTDMPCYDLGAPVAIQYLPEITFTQTQTCTNVTATISGGLPAVNGSQFTASALTPANATFVNTTANNGGTIGITGLTPGQAYSFQVTDGNGCPKTISGTFVGGPTLSYPQAAYCPVGTASPTITGATGGTYTSTAGLSINASTGVINLLTSTPNTYTVTYTTPAVPGPACPATFVITVRPLPTIVANDVTICFGGTVSVTASGASTYTWSPGTYLSATTGSTVSSTPAATQLYTVTGTDVNGCVNTDPVTVTVNGNAPINAGSDVFICIGASTTLAAFGGSTYNWTGLGAGNNFSVSPTTTTIYTVNGSDINNCLGSDQITVTVNPLPTVTVTNATVCAGASATVTANPGVPGTYSYAWTVPSGASAPGNIASFSTTIAGTYSVIITNTTTNCVSASASGTVTVNPLPTATVNSPTVCAGSTATITATPGVAGTYNYAWTVPSGATNPGNAVSFSASLSGTYSVILTNPTTLCNSVVASGLVTINPNPVITLTPTDPTTCNGTDGNITVNGTGTGTIAWSGAASGSVSNTALPYTIPTLSSGNYSVVFTNSTTTCVSTSVSTLLNNPGAPIINTLPNLVSCGTSFTLSEANITGTNLSANVGYFSSPNGVGPIADGTVYNSPTPSTTVYVYDANGICSAQISFTITVNPVPTVTVNNPTVCAGAPITVTATPGTPGTYSYAWTVPSGATSPGSVASFTATVAGTYSVIITNTTTNCVSTSASGIVTINPLPSATVNSSTICAGTSATVTATPSTAATYNYSWTVPASASAPGNIASFSTSVAGTYSVILTNATTLCSSSSASGTVVVNPLPTATIAGTITLCQGETAPVVTLTGANGTAPYIFTYNLNNGANQTVTSTGNTATLTAPTSAAGTFTYNLVSVQDASITACSQAQTGTATITVNPLPTATISGTSTVCVGAPSQTVTFTGANGTAPYTFTYTLNGGAAQTIVSTGSTATITVTTGTAGNFNYALTSVEDASATGCSQNQSGNAIVTINPTPNVFAGNNVSVCEGETVTLTGSGANIYAWDNGITNGIAFVPSLGTTTYTVTGTSAGGCVNTDLVDVTVNPNPIVSFSPDQTLGCAPLTVNFTNNTANSSDCVWSFSNGTVLTGCGTVPVTFTQGGCYDATLTTTSANGCTSSATYASIVCVEALPIAEFAPSENQLSTLNTEVIFDNTSVGASTFLWNFGDGSATSDATDPSHLYPSDVEENYVVMLIAYSPLGCTDTAYSTIQIYEELIFYVPNTFTPDTDDYNPVFKPIFTSGFDPYDYTLLIFNRWGEIIFESHNSEIGWDGSYGSNREFEMCQDGTYTWKIEFKTTKNDARRMSVGHVNLIR